MTFARLKPEVIAAQKEARKQANLSALCIPAKRKGVYAPVDEVLVEVPKVRPVRCAAYRRLVAAMPCCICGVEGFSQCAHANFGKALAMKSDDRNSFALCSTRAGIVGCHEMLDQHALMTKEERRAFEIFAGRMTRRLITAAGNWPSNLPRLETT